MAMKSGSCSQKGLETTQRQDDDDDEDDDDDDDDEDDDDDDDDDESIRHRGYIWDITKQERAKTLWWYSRTPMIAFITWISAWKLGIWSQSCDQNWWYLYNIL